MKSGWIFWSMITLSLCLLVSCYARRGEPFQENFVAETESIRNGQQQYMRYCQKCHPNGEAGLGPALNINPAPRFIKRFQVRHGLGVMPSFKKNEITKDNLRDLTKYMKALKQHD